METDVVRMVYSSFYHRAPYGISVVNRKGIILQANEAFSNLCGLPISHLIGLSIFSLTHPRDQWEEREKFRRFAVSEETEISYETRWQLQDGSTRSVQAALSKMNTGSNSASWFLATCKDIEGVKRQEALERARRRRSDAAELASSAGYWEWSEASTPSLYCSAGMYSILGMGSMDRELTEEWLVSRVEPGDWESFIEMEKGNSFSATFRIRRMDDGIRSVLVTGTRVAEEEGNGSYWTGTYRDITELQLAERKLQLHEKMSRRVHDTLQDIICRIEPDRTISYLSPSFYAITGYTEEEMKNIAVDKIIPAEDIQMIRSHMADSSKDNQAASVRCRTREGAMLWLEAAIIPMPEDFAPAGSYLLVARDQTEKMNIHEQALNSDKLTAAGGLAAGIAHEIRNPLTAIKGFIQLMKNGTVKQEFLDIILSELSRIDTIVRELLILSKPHSVAYSPTELYPLLDHVITLINTQAILHRVEIEHFYRMDSVKLLCDENQIKQVLINLFKNAIEAMPNGGLITLETEYGEAHSVQIRITDQGVGISKENLEKIGQMFYTTKESGTGLGMMICHEIIKHHGGKMALRSTQGVGTTVEITLPLAR